MTASPLGRVIEIAEDGRYLAKVRGFLSVSASGAEVGRVALDDISAVIASSPATTVSCALLSELASRGIPFVLCGRNFAPAALLWPVVGHHAQQRRMEAQIDGTRPLAKRLWALVVAAKVRRQGWTLAQARKAAGAFERLARLVKSGDPDNIEAQAARRYWPLLMGKEFQRDADAAGINSLLNYGYAVLRGATARAIVAAGLHPGIGLFHRHPYDTMPLADDLMEPFRPVVDLEVFRMAAEGAGAVTVATKRRLAGLLWQDERSIAGTSPLSTCINRLAASVAESFLTGEPVLEFPLLSMKKRDEGGSEDADA